ncbi:MAG: hypothetical protein ACRBCT_09385 [Alphaproteobacteria bacterium]
MSSKELLTCFFQESEKQFRFLELEHGYRYLSGMVEYRNNYKIIAPFRNRSYDEPFLATTRYEFEEHALEILYGDENYHLEMFIYTDSFTRLSLQDILLARRKDGSLGAEENWLTKPEVIVDTLAVLAAHIREHATHLLPPNEKLVDRALTIRGKMIEQGIRAHYEKALKEAGTRAAAAFMRKDYQGVIDVLAPFVDDLSAADLKKLKLARRKLGLI